MNPSTDILHTDFARLRPQLIRPAEGFLKHDYLVPGGYYQEQWDWDGFFIGAHLASRSRKEAVYLKYWALNYIAASDDEGRVPGCVTPKGPEKGHRAFPMKPFLAQGCYFSSARLGDFSWIVPRFDCVQRIIARRERTLFDANYGLFFWESAMQSGADNNPALTNDPNDRNAILACDMNTFQLREYLALSRIADKLGRAGDAKQYAAKADALLAAMNRHLWDQAGGSYFNVRRDTGAFVKRVTYSNFSPLWHGAASQDSGRRMIRRYLWNDQHMLAPFGLRTLSRQDPEYNNQNMIWPYSNWQGPVWPIANFFYSGALLNYGFRDEARRLAQMIANLCLKDIERFGSMHENYDADTGAPLAPSGDQSPKGKVEAGFIGWNLLVENMAEDADSGRPFLAM
jgi:alpha,alpha-trehalase